MIVSHQHKFIFIKTAKTAGTSIEIALGNLCADGDIITKVGIDEQKRISSGHRGHQNNHIPLKYYTKGDWARLLVLGKRLNYYNHISALELRRKLDPIVWKTYFKFCFERNPFDKVVSNYFYTIKEHNISTIFEYLKSGKAGKMKGLDLYSNGSISLVDKVYRYEELNDSLEEIKNKLNLPGPISLPDHRYKSEYRTNRKHYRKILSEEEKELIEVIFARELKLYNYSF